MERYHKFSLDNTDNFVLSGIHIADFYKAVLKDAAPDACVGGRHERESEVRDMKARTHISRARERLPQATPDDWTEGLR